MTQPSAPLNLDPLLPPAMAEACELLGVRKAGQGLVNTLVLAGLAGAFIGLGAMLFTVVMTDPGMGYGPARLLGGVAFSLGLVLVIIAGAELFTGNTLIVMACANRRISVPSVLRNWGLVYAGNFAGAVLTVLLVLGSKQWQFNNAEVGGTALRIAHAKVQLGFVEAIFLGILCNVLVTLAVWLTLGARSNTDKILSILFPITAFVAAGFEHSIANMYFIPAGILLKDEAAAAEASGLTAAQLDTLDWPSFLLENLLPVTIGNIIGGAVLVAGVYWFVFLRPRVNSK